MKVRILDHDGEALTNWSEARSDQSQATQRWRVDLHELLGRRAADTAGLRDLTLEIQSGR